MISATPFLAAAADAKLEDWGPPAVCSSSGRYSPSRSGAISRRPRDRI